MTCTDMGYFKNRSQKKKPRITFKNNKISVSYLCKCVLKDPGQS